MLSGLRTILTSVVGMVCLTVLLAMGKVSAEVGVPALLFFGGAGLGRGLIGARK